MNKQEKIDYITQKLTDPSTEAAMIGSLLTELIKCFDDSILDNVIDKFNSQNPS